MITKAWNVMKAFLAWLQHLIRVGRAVNKRRKPFEPRRRMDRDEQEPFQVNVGGTDTRETQIAVSQMSGRVRVTLLKTPDSLKVDTLFVPISDDSEVSAALNISNGQKGNIICIKTKEKPIYVTAAHIAGNASKYDWMAITDQVYATDALACPPARVKEGERMIVVGFKQGTTQSCIVIADKLINTKIKGRLSEVTVGVIFSARFNELDAWSGGIVQRGSQCFVINMGSTSKRTGMVTLLATWVNPLCPPISMQTIAEDV